LRRGLLGIPDDLLWRAERGILTASAGQPAVALTGRVAGAALFICALWIIDADASLKRTRSVPAGPAVARAVQLSAATDPVVFEAVSVRPNTSSEPYIRFEPQSPGRFTALNAPAALLISFAYDLPNFRVSGGPGWLDSARFDVIATTNGIASVEHKRAMLKRVLAERFKFNAHTESRDLPIYALMLARRDRRPGPQLRPTKADCASVEPSSLGGIGPAPEGGPPACGFFGFAPATQFASARGGIAFRGMTLAMFAKRLVPIVRRHVDDRTRLPGYFDGDFDFVGEVPMPPPPPGAPNPVDAPFASIFAVLPDQLGLKLESTRGPVELLVIDSIERPSPE
jgi:uncharacterized protein (TIGR03435 family)